ncbi:protein S40-5-like [Primulina huaijiensis]|uniref:protein S40-5-like n=1 Tax=Primulina huaijiensis TaxID=1492673 RepID=UPI003CC6F64F
MAKGRKLTTSRSERYLGSFGSNNGQETLNGAAELGEDEVLSLMDNTANGDDHSPKGEWNSSTVSNGTFSIYSSHRPPPSVSHHHHRQVGGLSLAFDDSNTLSSPRIVHQVIRGQDMESPRGRHVATSAPVNVPDWSKIYRVDSVESLHEWEDDFDDNDLEVVPPHEYLAREHRRSRKAAANSVFEGVGRTLKGRDLSRVRDAVWSQTGFDG